ncbi:YfcE family phosphodiesterase [[Clostridium] polysaccharolyticum]|uniref:Phosphoesterase n=1 Tax=[Clostridium] polysaccharolyticum TaxID=29364 RepID=A0A1I0FSZ5_9FIRM|nr:metallophosphoesterase [[Clostridium] polysaccharolyticum]SET61365.1 hypothetical protein SAMN04487772_13715 [[Clostridium] polysaccharolyticum]
MKILIVSDSHGRNNYLSKVLDKVGDVDMFLHLGDLEGTEDFIEAFVDCRVEMIAGNNDYFTEIPREKLIQIGKYTIFMTHGHLYSVYFGTEQLKEAARMRGADIVMYGHTHMPSIDQSDDVIAINPGSISKPRQPGRQPSFILMEIDKNGEAHFTINYV